MAEVLIVLFPLATITLITLLIAIYLQIRSKRTTKIKPEHLWVVVTALCSACLVLSMAMFLSPRQGLREDPPGGHVEYYIEFMIYTFVFFLASLFPTSRSALKWQMVVIFLSFGMLALLAGFVWFHYPPNQFSPNVQRPITNDFLFPFAFGCLLMILGGTTYLRSRRQSSEDSRKAANIIVGEAV